jgi:acyl-CoA thioesterase II
MRDPAGDFEADTAVSGGDGRYGATLSRSWELWGPAGGYVSAIALRAAGAHSRFDRPASYSCSYLGVADFAPIEIHATTLRAAKRSDVVRVRLSQSGRAFLEATVWTIDAGMHGLEHDHAPMPDVAGPDGLRAWMDVVPPSENRFATFWSNIEERVIDQWFGDWRERPATAPVRESWCRFRPKATFADPYLDAARSLMLIDTLGWPAAVAAHGGRPEYIAPTIELSARFHRLAPKSEWLLEITESAVATDGLLGSTARVWSQDGALVASGGQTMLFRPVPG